MMNEPCGLHGASFAQGGGQRTTVPAQFAALLVAVLENVFDAGMPKDFMPKISRNPFRAVIPEDDPPLAVHDVEAALESLEYGPVNLRVFES